MNEDFKNSIQAQLADIRNRIIEVENWQEILQNPFAKKIIKSLDEQIIEIREQYAQLDQTKENFLVHFSRLQGAEDQVVRYKNWLLGMDELKKSLVKERDNLVILEQDEERGNAPRGGILSKSLKKENDNA